MKTTTAKSVEDVVFWVENNAHHKGAWVGPCGSETHFELSGRDAKIKIPTAIQEKSRGLIDVGDRFDTRMYRANKKGIKLLKASGLIV